MLADDVSGGHRLPCRRGEGFTERPYALGNQPPHGPIGLLRGDVVEQHLRRVVGNGQSSRVAARQPASALTDQRIPLVQLETGEIEDARHVGSRSGSLRDRHAPVRMREDGHRPVDFFQPGTDDTCVVVHPRRLVAAGRRAGQVDREGVPPRAASAGTSLSQHQAPCQAPWTSRMVGLPCTAVVMNRPSNRNSRGLPGKDAEPYSDGPSQRLNHRGRDHDRLPAERRKATPGGPCFIVHRSCPTVRGRPGARECATPGTTPWRRDAGPCPASRQPVSRRVREAW